MAMRTKVFFNMKEYINISCLSYSRLYYLVYEQFFGSNLVRYIPVNKLCTTKMGREIMSLNFNIFLFPLHWLLNNLSFKPHNQPIFFCITMSKGANLFLIFYPYLYSIVTKMLLSLCLTLISSQALL